MRSGIVRITWGLRLTGVMMCAFACATKGGKQQVDGGQFAEDRVLGTTDDQETDAAADGASEGELYSVCMEHADCGGTGLVCDPRRGCVECLVDVDCGGARSCQLGVCEVVSRPNDDVVVDPDEEVVKDSDDDSASGIAGDSRDAAFPDAATPDSVRLVDDASADAGAHQDAALDRAMTLDASGTNTPNDASIGVTHRSEAGDGAASSGAESERTSDPTCAELDCVGGCELNLAIVYRDFPESHPDFGDREGQCTRVIEESGMLVPADAVSEGLVAAELDERGLPMASASEFVQQCESGANVSSYTGAVQFGDWYSDGNGRQTVARQLTLFSDGDGSFSNRYGDAGQRWVGIVDETYDGNGAFTCSWCLDGTCQDPCRGDFSDFEGDPLFFPLDGMDGGSGGTGPARVPAAFGYGGEPWEENVVGRGSEHNFYFTTELRFSFDYHEGLDASVQVIGDDDIWVFINGKLAIDLGGRHAAATQGTSVSSAVASVFGLVPGNRYEVAIFHAERRMPSSSFGLTLNGFDTVTSSNCAP